VSRVIFKPLAPLASLRLTVLLMVLSIGLIFFGTLAQVDRGIWHVMDQYFRSVYVLVPLQIFVPRTQEVGGVIPWPGGATLGTLLLINLLAAHAVRFKLTWKRSGVLLIHASLILLIVGEGLTAILAVESQMPIYQGQTITWSHDIRKVELTIIDPTDENQDRVVVVPQHLLEKAANTGQQITDPQLPFEIRVDRYFANSVLTRAQPNDPIQAPARDGVMVKAMKTPRATGVGDQMVDIPSAHLRLSRKGQELGRFLVSVNLESDFFTPIMQEVEVDGVPWQIALRFHRYYKPYRMTLLEFRHDLYPGTQVPKNFSSDVRLVNEQVGDDREVKIYMNNPLRYRGETFFQSGYLPGNRGTILQVVNNPGWTMPYIACAIGSLGLVLQFGISLSSFLRRRAK